MKLSLRYFFQRQGFQVEAKTLKKFAIAIKVIFQVYQTKFEMKKQNSIRVIFFLLVVTTNSIKRPTKVCGCKPEYGKFIFVFKVHLLNFPFCL